MENNIVLPDIPQKIKNSKPEQYPLYQYIENIDNNNAGISFDENISIPIPVIHCNNAHDHCWFLCTVVDWAEKIVDAFLCMNFKDGKYGSNCVAYVDKNIYNKMFDKHYLILHIASDDNIDRIFQHFKNNFDVKTRLVKQYKAMVSLFNPDDINKFDSYVSYDHEDNTYASMLTDSTYLKRSGKYGEAITILEKAISMEPYEATAYYNYGKINCILGKYDLALQNYLSTYNFHTEGIDNRALTMHIGWAFYMLSASSNDFKYSDNKYFYLSTIDPYRQKYYLKKINCRRVMKENHRECENMIYSLGAEYIKLHGHKEAERTIIK